MTTRGVAVVSDGSALADQSPDSVVSMLARYAALIEDLAGLPVRVLHLDAGDPAQADASLRSLPAELGAIFLPHVREEFTCRARALTSTPV